MVDHAHIFFTSPGDEREILAVTSHLKTLILVLTHCITANQITDIKIKRNSLQIKICDERVTIIHGLSAMNANI